MKAKMSFFADTTLSFLALANWSVDEGCMLWNTSQSVIITPVYNGIPQTLILNLISWAFLILLFCVLRRTAWNYERMALVQRSKSRWTNLFYRSGDNEELVNRTRSAEEPPNIDEGFFTWLPAVFRLSREQILVKCGPDAVHYLSFQRKTGKRIMVPPKWCGPEVDALEFYTNEQKRLKDEAKRIRAIVLNDPLGIAFLTLPSYQLPEHVINSFSLHRGWVLTHATNPADIIWENLNVQPGVWYIKAFFVNFFLFIVLFFLTTPAVIVNLFNTLVAKPEHMTKVSTVIFDFLPTCCCGQWQL
ncbi:calcium permeable stress-gated cation channel 1-like [Amyelois transitella]|uniref:calcium permeable stress-gated cation channel 1-like n=1 Tax=Amyelois transitella TaxID=680683 RepID=UPI00298F6292|nr:calcium permeable stress-gated cation channel 1-like [Amyelois transitella]